MQVRWIAITIYSVVIFYCLVVFFMYFTSRKKQNLRLHNEWEAIDNDFVFGAKKLLLDVSSGCFPVQNLHVIFNLWNIPVSVHFRSMNRVLTWGAQLAKFRGSGIAAEYRQGRGTTCRGLPEAEADEYPGPCSSCRRTLIMCQAQEAGTRQQALSNSRSLLVTAFTICSTQFSKHFLVFIVTGYTSDHFIVFRIFNRCSGFSQVEDISGLPQY